MVNVLTTKWSRVMVRNPNRNRLLIQNITAAADVYIGFKASQDVDILTSYYKLIGIDEIELKHHKGEIWCLAGTATADVRVIEE